MGLDFLRYRSKTLVSNQIFLNNVYPGLIDYIVISRTGPGSIAIGPSRSDPFVLTLSDIPGGLLLHTSLKKSGNEILRALLLSIR